MLNTVYYPWKFWGGKKKAHHQIHLLGMVQCLKATKSTNNNEVLVRSTNMPRTPTYITLNKDLQNMHRLQPKESSVTGVKVRLFFFFFNDATKWPQIQVSLWNLQLRIPIIRLNTPFFIFQRIYHTWMREDDMGPNL